MTRGSGLDLLVLDINGVLLDRVPMRGEGSNAVQRTDRSLLTVASTRVYLRPDAAEFLEWALERFHVAVWTSARVMNAAPMMRALVGEDGLRNLAFMWCQDRCTPQPRNEPSPPHGQSPILFLKDLRRVRKAWPSIHQIAVLDDSPVGTPGDKMPGDLLAGAWRLDASASLAPSGALRAELEARLAARSGPFPVPLPQPRQSPWSEVFRRAAASEAATTADGRLGYSEVVCGRSLATWCALAHDALVRASGWAPVPLRPGMFGFDNLVSSAAALLDAAGDHGGFIDLDSAAAAVHSGWVANYVFWRDHLPHESSRLYFRPGKPLGDERRDFCAAKAYADLTDDEKEKDRIIARAVMGALVEH